MQPPWENADFGEKSATAASLRMSEGHRAMLRYAAGVRGISGNALVVALIEEEANRLVQPTSSPLLAEGLALIEEGLQRMRKATAR